MKYSDEKLKQEFPQFKKTWYYEDTDDFMFISEKLEPILAFIVYKSASPKIDREKVELAVKKYNPAYLKFENMEVIIEKDGENYKMWFKYISIDKYSDVFQEIMSGNQQN